MSDIVERLKEPMPRHLFFPLADALCMEAADEITRLRQLLSEAEKREAEERAKAVSVAEAEYKRHCTGSGFDSQPARSTAHRILEALKALQSEER